MANGRAVLVTGGSRGIGAAVARAFAEAGDRVAVHYNARADQAAEVAASLPGRRARRRRRRPGRPEAVRRMVDRAAGELGGLDVLVNNAGVFFDHPIAATTYEEWQQGWSDTLGVNLVGAANVTWCAVAAHAPRRRGGRIVNVSSRGAFRGEPRRARLRREQGGPDRVRPVARPRARRARHLGRLGRARVHRDRHGGRGAVRPARRRPPRREPVRPRRDAGGGRRGGALPRLARRPSSRAAPCST